MKKILLLTLPVILALLVGVGIVTNVLASSRTSKDSKEVTFSNYQIYYDSNSRINPISCSLVPGASGGTCDGGYFPDMATANKLCQKKGYDKAVSFTTQCNFFTSCHDNFMWQSTGKNVKYVWACRQNTGIDTVTCKKENKPEPKPEKLHLISSSAPKTVYEGDEFQIKCNFGVANLPCVGAIHDNSDSCSYEGYYGTTAIFNCVAGEPGLKKNYCNIFSYSQDPRCVPQQNKIQSTEVLPKCESHEYKECDEDGVYWYDSCDNREELVQECGADEYCEEGECIQQDEPGCECDADCGENETCQENQCIQNGDEPQACQCDADCGPSEFVDGDFCQDGNVYKNYVTRTCDEGTCDESVNPVLWVYCQNGDTCTDGACQPCADDGHSI